MTADVHGRLTVAGHAQRDVYRLEILNPESQITILADSYTARSSTAPTTSSTALTARSISLILHTACARNRTRIRKSS